MAIPLVTLLIVPLLLLALLLLLWLPAFAERLLQADGQLLSLLWHAMGHWQTSLHSLGGLERVPEGPLLVAALLGVGLLPLPGFRGRLLVMALLLLPLLLPRTTSRSEDLSVLFADVGQGTAVLLRLAEDSLLYDTGGGAPGAPPLARHTILPLLRGQGISSLDYLIISHPDRDHNAGEMLIREELRPRYLRHGIALRGSERACRPGERQRFGARGSLQFLSLRLPGDSDNNASCVLMIEAYGRRILLPGDIDAQRERELLSYWGGALRADVLMLAHHGSGGSSSRLWLRSVAPDLAVASAGYRNRFGHPAERVVEAVEAQGSELLNTAEHGAIELRVTPDGALHRQCYRHSGAPFWRRGPVNQRCEAF